MATRNYCSDGALWIRRCHRESNKSEDGIIRHALLVWCCCERTPDASIRSAIERFDNMIIMAFRTGTSADARKL